MAEPTQRSEQERGTPGLRLPGVGTAAHTCLQDVALLDGHVLQPAGLLLQLEGRVAERQAGDHVLGDPERALAGLHGVHLRLQRLHLTQQVLEVRGHSSQFLS